MKNKEHRTAIRVFKYSSKNRKLMLKKAINCELKREYMRGYFRFYYHRETNKFIFIILESAIIILESAI